LRRTAVRRAPGFVFPAGPAFGFPARFDVARVFRADEAFVFRPDEDFGAARSGSFRPPVSRFHSSNVSSEIFPSTSNCANFRR
jgi:hypothetical protein